MKSWLNSQCMRSLALAGAGASGGLVGAVVQLLRDVAWGEQSYLLDPSPLVGVDPLYLDTPGPFGIDLKSLCLGIFIGYWLGPLLETLVLLRQLWGLQLRAHFRVQEARPAYRVVG